MNIRLICLKLLCVTIFGFLSCDKYLDKKSNTGITVPISISDLQSLLDNGVDMNYQRTPAFSDASSDDYFVLQEDYDAMEQRDKYAYTWNPFDNYGMPNDWSFCYMPVYNSNYCLEQIEKNEKNSSNGDAWNNVKGSALFFRSYYFLQLVWSFSNAYNEPSAATDFGIAIRTKSDFNIPSVRASLKETYEKIISDAKESIEYLPSVPAHSVRPSKGAAYGLLSRAYLTMRKYDSAYKYAELSLNINSHLMNYNGDADIVAPLDEPSCPFKQFNRETIFYSEQSFNVSSLAFGKIDTLLYASFADNDLRKKAFFTANGDYMMFKGVYTGDGYTPFTGIATDELYLIKAECLARGINGNQGNVDDAMATLNSLLVKRYDETFSGLTATNASDALAKILVERRKELIFRGLRFIDIKRLNKENANIILKRKVDGNEYILSPNDNRYALPLPKDVINSSGMAQNPY